MISNFEQFLNKAEEHLVLHYNWSVPKAYKYVRKNFSNYFNLAYKIGQNPTSSVEMLIFAIEVHNHG